MKGTTIRTRVVLLPVLMLALSACASGGGPLEREGERPILFGLPAIIDSVINTPPLDRTHWGIAAYDPEADRVLARVNYEKHFIPASNTKLVTTAAGLALLGPDFRYTTMLRAIGGTRAAPAALLLDGRGDPSLSFRFHEGGELGALGMLADSVVAAGIGRVNGPLIVDTRYFDDRRVHTAWEVGDLDWSYASPVSGFAVDEATVTLVIEPGAAPGEAAQVRALTPEGMIRIENALVTDTAFSRYEWGFLRLPGEDAFRFEGTVPLNTRPDTIRIPVRDPAEFAGEALVELLEQRGVEVEGGVNVVRGEEVLPVQVSGARPVASWTSPPLSQIAAEILKPSNNWVAEQLLKTLGAELGEGGSWEEGLRVEREWMVDVVGIDSTSFLLKDGSGLTAQNLLSPEAIVRLLTFAREQSWGAAYRAALAEPGEDGTLERRLTALQGRTYAKTGTITNVNALSGYIINAAGNEVVFSIMTNATGEPASEVRPAIDRLVEAFAQIGAPPPPPPRRQDPLAP